MITTIANRKGGVDKTTITLPAILPVTGGHVIRKED